MTCRKKSYLTLASAKKQAKKYKKPFKRRSRAYKCPLCNYYHLTTQKKKT